MTWSGVPRWIANPSRAVDLHVAFRADLLLEADEEVALQVLGATWYRFFVDGHVVHEGPARFPESAPEYSTLTLSLKAGTHSLAAQVHHAGVATRMMPDISPFLACRVVGAAGEHPLSWRCRELVGQRPTSRRTSPILGWVEWLDTRVDGDWWAPEFDDHAWAPAVPLTIMTERATPLSTAEVRTQVHTMSAVAGGSLYETYGFYELDDPPVRFLLRDLGVVAPGDGVWRRYDLGRIRLGVPRLVLDLPPGAVVEIGGSDTLGGGRVAPVLPGSTGPSCTISHLVSRGGIQELRPFTPKGQRYLEVHVLTPGPVRFVAEEFVERGYFGEPEGSFDCDDERLNQVWSTSMETLRACAEDSVVDCPSRERGEWLGDVASVGLEIAAVGYGDLGLFRRGLTQAAACADAEGFVAGLYPGDLLTVSSYALQWVSACVRYGQLTGDLSLWDELFSCASANLKAFESRVGVDGYVRGVPWSFIDWGYAPDGDTDIALQLHLLTALRAYVTWADQQVAVEAATWARGWERRLTAALKFWLGEQLDGEGVGFHCAVLATLAQLPTSEQLPDLISGIKRHILNCYPNDVTAPRLSDPALVESRLITPYFAHWALAALIEHGEMTFVLAQYDRCWGWMLDQGATTWWEVFDPRWSQCHQWSGAPAWQLSRYVVGFHPRFDRGAGEAELRIMPGSLGRAAGVFPLPDGQRVEVSWVRVDDRVSVTLTSSRPLRLTVFSGTQRSEVVKTAGAWEGEVHAWTVAPPRSAAPGGTITTGGKPGYEAIS